MADATIIMAGGSGTRLWPASLPHAPKQLLRIGAVGPDGRPQSLVQQAILRGAAATPDGPIVIVTHRDHVAPIREHVDELGSFEGMAGLPGRITFLPEPVGRNTAPAIALGARYLITTLGDTATALVLTADHVIEPVERFVEDADAAVAAARSGRLVTFGIPPTRPETGYGYIQAGAPLPAGRAVEAFREKPDAQTAERYLASGDYLWNSGMFAFVLGHFWSELSDHEAAVALPFEPLTAETLTSADALEPLYSGLPKISIDYALMERSTSVAVIPATFSWNDVGSWDEAAKLAGAAHPPELVEVEAEGNFVDSDIPVAICGVSGVHVVVKNGKLLVCRRGESQLVKEAVEAAEQQGTDAFFAPPDA